MAYTKTNWATAKISAANLNKAQTQYQQAIVDMWDARTNTAKEIRAYVVSDFPAHRAGLLIFHTGMKRFFMSNGSAWLVPPTDALFGGGTGGDFSSTGNIVLPNAVGATVIADYASFKLNENHVLTTQSPCRCLIIRSWGDIVIDGGINMDKRGGFPGRYITISGVQYDLQGGNGGNGGDGGHGHISYGWGGSGGYADANEDCAGGRRGGGGGGGGAYVAGGEPHGGAGGPKNTGVNSSLDPQWGGSGGTPSGGYTQSGGAGTRGAGGGGAGITVPSYNYYAYGGNGGGSRGGGSGGGGGASVVFGSRNGDGENGFPSPGEYGGGALVLLAGGDIVVNGQILARGGTGGNGGTGDIAGTGTGGAGGGGGGGGQGGGRVLILHRGGHTIDGEIIITGGDGGAGSSGAGTGTEGSYGSSGSPGSVQAVQL